MHILELPYEVFVFEIAVFMDSVSLRVFSEVCVVTRKMFMEMKKEIERILNENVAKRRESYLNKLKKWTEKRNEMTETQKKDADLEFYKCMGKYDYNWGKELSKKLKPIYEKGGGGFDIPIYELSGPECDIGHIAYEMMEFTSTIKNARTGLEAIKIQVDAQVSLKCRRYVGNGGSPVEDFFGYQIGSGLYKKNATEEYLELNLEVIRVCRAAGGEFNKPNDFVSFLRNASYSFQRAEHTEKKRMKKVMIKFVRFLIEEIGSNPLEIYEEDGDHDQSAFLMALTKPEIQFIIPYLINPYESSDRFWKYLVPNFSSLSSKMFSSHSSRKLLKKLLRVKNLCRSICDQNPFFLFDLIERKERKLVNLTIRELGIDFCVNTLRDSDSNSLLHILCGVRGKTEKMVKFLLNLGFDVNEKNIKGETPIMKSLEIHHFKVTKILKEHAKKEKNN